MPNRATVNQNPHLILSTTVLILLPVALTRSPSIVNLHYIARIRQHATNIAIAMAVRTSIDCETLAVKEAYS